ncbi:MAG: hypothetical protein JWN02_2806, partial [Acidobacteria bacterium]|nr:hypothetical protein [Acidobacteriota bacterium]
MDDAVTSQPTEAAPALLRNLVWIVREPSAAMADLVARPDEKTVIQLLLLASLGILLKDISWPALRTASATIGTWRLTGIMAIAVVAVGLLTFACFYAFSFVVTFVGRLFGGEGKWPAVRTGLAWGLAPLVWSIVYRLPMTLVARPSVPRLHTGPAGPLLDVLGSNHVGWTLTLILLVVQIVILLWIVLLSSLGVAEAHRISFWNGLATLMLAASTPIVITI